LHLHTFHDYNATDAINIFGVQAENAGGTVYRYRYEPHDDF
jgi:hypothetical protein